MIALVLQLVATTPDTGAMAAALRQSLVATTHAGMRWPDIADARDVLQRGYSERAWRPYWSANGHVTVAGRRVLTDLDSAGSRGLDPTDFDATRLHAIADSLPMLGIAGVAEFDVMMSASTARLASALIHGRTDPHTLHPMLELAPDSADVARVLESLTQTSRSDTIFDNLAPRHATYRRLIELLAQYRRLAPPSGVRGGDTVAPRIRQIERALERWRWLPHGVNAPWVVVNIPAFQLYAMGSDREDRDDVLRMHVVAGRALGHRTPLLMTSIVAVQFHPPWLVPASIASAEIRPLALRDSGYLARMHFELLRGDSTVPSVRANLLRIGAGIDVRQAPGPWNALGEIKFVTPNGASVYLHDTPEQSAFRLDRRDVSHGCIRVADPTALAEFALQGEPEWTADRLAEALGDTVTRVVPLRHRIPVFVIYQTLVPRESGGILSYPDVYGFDKRLESMLRGPFTRRDGPIS
jgi:murein L,D-transpeptidase YcbB/YkuD